ncbi:exported hypothetical protein [Burkholderiales bacterium]|nr:exported hypothetical protein [Burkholderiales bacterium]
MQPIGRLLLRALSCAALIAGRAHGEASKAAPVLGAYNVDPGKITVSGFSASGFLAMQMVVAYSSVFKGVGIFAGGPYDCARQAGAIGLRKRRDAANQRFDRQHAKLERQPDR